MKKAAPSAPAASAAAAAAPAEAAPAVAAAKKAAPAQEGGEEGRAKKGAPAAVKPGDPADPAAAPARSRSSRRSTTPRSPRRSRTSSSTSRSRWPRPSRPMRRPPRPTTTSRGTTTRRRGGHRLYFAVRRARCRPSRSCVAALLVLAGIALGREAMSFRLVASARSSCCCSGPRRSAGPSFQLSFAAVIAIIACTTHGRARAGSRGATKACRPDARARGAGRDRPRGRESR